MNDKVICKICQKECVNIQGLSNHVRRHSIKTKDYYDQYLKKDEGICLTCGKPTSLLNMCCGYHKYCSISCAQSSIEVQYRIRNTNLNRRGQNGKIIFSDDHKLKLAQSIKGKKHSEKTKLKQSESHRGKKFTEEHKKKLKRQFSSEHRQHLSTAMKGKKKSEKHKDRLRASSLRNIEIQSFGGGPIFPGIGKNEKHINDILCNSVELESLRNSRTLFQKCHKFIDAYITKYNLAIEVLEPHHYKYNGELRDKDKTRELKISSSLGCMIYYVPEQEFLTNPKKEIQRFKDFISLLNAGPN